MAKKLNVTAYSEAAKRFEDKLAAARAEFGKHSLRYAEAQAAARAEFVQEVEAAAAEMVIDQEDDNAAR